MIFALQPLYQCIAQESGWTSTDDIGYDRARIARDAEPRSLDCWLIKYDGGPTGADGGPSAVDEIEPRTASGAT